MSLWQFILQHRAEILERTLEHLWLVAAAMGMAILIGLPLGIALVGRRTLRRWVLGVANVMQTVPSLALFGFLIPVPFLGGIAAQPTAIVGRLALYALPAHHCATPIPASPALTRPLSSPRAPWA